LGKILKYNYNLKIVVNAQLKFNIAKSVINADKDLCKKSKNGKKLELSLIKDQKSNKDKDKAC
jgi:hypothetical protein